MAAPVPVDPVAQHRREGRKSVFFLLLDIMEEAKGQAMKTVKKEMIDGH